MRARGKGVSARKARAPSHLGALRQDRVLRLGLFALRSALLLQRLLRGLLHRLVAAVLRHSHLLSHASLERLLQAASDVALPVAGCDCFELRREPQVRADDRRHRVIAASRGVREELE